MKQHIKHYEILVEDGFDDALIVRYVSGGYDVVAVVGEGQLRDHDDIREFCTQKGYNLIDIITYQ